MVIPANAKYQIIHEMMQRDDNRLSVKFLCDTAAVSRSGYYHYLATNELRLQREEQEMPERVKDICSSYIENQEL